MQARYCPGKNNNIWLNCIELSCNIFSGNLLLSVEVETEENVNKGRSPEEKVKGHSGAIYRGPLMLYTKYQGSSRF